MEAQIDLKLCQGFQENIVCKRAVYLDRILQVGFSGIVDLLMEEEFQQWMRYKLKDGSILEDMFQQQRKTVKKVILDAEKDRDKLYCNGIMTLIDKKI